MIVHLHHQREKNQQVITPDQKERMEQNRKEALLKRQRQGQLDPQSFVIKMLHGSVA